MTGTVRQCKASGLITRGRDFDFHRAGGDELADFHENIGGANPGGFGGQQGIDLAGIQASKIRVGRVIGGKRADFAGPLRAKRIRGEDLPGIDRAILQSLVLRRARVGNKRKGRGQMILAMDDLTVAIAHHQGIRLGIRFIRPVEHQGGLRRESRPGHAIGIGVIQREGPGRLIAGTRLVHPGFLERREAAGQLITREIKHANGLAIPRQRVVAHETLAIERQRHHFRGRFQLLGTGPRKIKGLRRAEGGEGRRHPRRVVGFQPYRGPVFPGGQLLAGGHRRDFQRRLVDHAFRGAPEFQGARQCPVRPARIRENRVQLVCPTPS